MIFHTYYCLKLQTKECWGPRRLSLGWHCDDCCPTQGAVARMSRARGGLRVLSGASWVAPALSRPTAGKRRRARSICHIRMISHPSPER